MWPKALFFLVVRPSVCAYMPTSVCMHGEDILNSDRLTVDFAAATSSTASFRLLHELKFSSRGLDKLTIDTK